MIWMPPGTMVQKNLLKNFKSWYKYWRTKNVMLMLKNKYNDIQSMSDEYLYILYHEETGFLTSRGRGKHWNLHIIHIRSHDEEFRKKLESELENDLLQCNRANETVKGLQEEFGTFMQTCPAYRLYTTPSRKVFLIHQNLVLTHLSLSSKKKILVK